MITRARGERARGRKDGRPFEVEDVCAPGASQRRSRRNITALVVAVLLLLIAAAGVALWQRNEARRRADLGVVRSVDLVKTLELLLAPRGGADPGDAESDLEGAGAARSGGGRGSQVFDQVARLLDGLRPSREWNTTAGRRARLLALLAQADEAQRSEEAGAQIRREAAVAAAVTIAMELLQRRDEASRPAAALALQAAGEATLRRGDHQLAKQQLLRALELSEPLGERKAVERALAVAAIRRGLAAAEVASGESERGEKQLRLGLQLLEEWARKPEHAPRMQPAIALTLAALGDLEVARQRRGAARGFYDRAWATLARGGERAPPLLAASVQAEEALSPPRRRLLLILGLRRLRQKLGGAEHCLPLLRYQVAVLALDEAGDWRRLDELLEACPRMPAQSYGAARALVGQLEAMHPRRLAALGRLRLTLALGLLDAARWPDAAAELEQGAELLEEALREGPEVPQLAGRGARDGAHPSAGAIAPHRTRPYRDSLRGPAPKVIAVAPSFSGEPRRASSTLYLGDVPDTIEPAAAASPTPTPTPTPAPAPAPPRDGDLAEPLDDAERVRARRALLELYRLRLASPTISSEAAASWAARCRRAASGPRWQAERVECDLAAAAHVTGADADALLLQLMNELPATVAAEDGSPAPRIRRLAQLGALAQLAASIGAPCEDVRAREREVAELLRASRAEWATGAPALSPLQLSDVLAQLDAGRRHIAERLRARRCPE